MKDIRCIFSIHSWDICSCRRCRKPLPGGQHNFGGGKCSICGMIDPQHVCRCVDCKCIICGKSMHDWKYEKETETIGEPQSIGYYKYADRGDYEDTWREYRKCKRCGKEETISSGSERGTYSW